MWRTKTAPKSRKQLYNDDEDGPPHRRDSGGGGGGGVGVRYHKGNKHPTHRPRADESDASRAAFRRGGDVRGAGGGEGGGERGGGRGGGGGGGCDCLRSALFLLSLLTVTVLVMYQQVSGLSWGAIGRSLGLGVGAGGGEAGGIAEWEARAGGGAGGGGRAWRVLPTTSFNAL